MKKWIPRILAVVVVLLVVVVAAVFFNLNRIVHDTVETQASSSLNLQTTLGGANLSLFGQSVNLTDLQIANPPGFNAPKLLSLRDAGVKVSLGQLRQDPIHITEVNLVGPELVIEQAGGKFNFNAVMDQLPKTDAPAPGTQTEPMKLIIDRLVVTNARVLIRPGIPGLDKELSIPLPAIELKGIGTGEGAQNGAAVKEVVMQLVTAMASKATESDLLPPELRVLLSTNVKDLARMATDRFKREIGNVTEKIGKEVESAVGDVIKNVKVPEGIKLPDGKDAGQAVQKGFDDRFKKKSPTTQPGE